MRFLGVEFRDFACFQRQFVPIESGLNVLVGKNNAGKTAILHGLYGLNALPLDPRGGFPSNLADYARSRTPAPTYDFDILFEVEPGDPPFIAGAEQLWERALSENDVLLRYKFRVWPTSSLIGFLECHSRLVRQDKKTDLVVCAVDIKNKSIVRSFYNYPGLTVAQANGKPFSSHSSAPDGSPVGSLSTFNDPLFKALESLRPVLFVAAHRVVQANTQMQTVENLTPEGGQLAGFLQTLHGRNREAFDEIEAFVTGVFPEFQYVNLSSKDNRISITLTRRDTRTAIPLSHCGTGVEQILFLATFVLTAPKGGMVLLDEPHSYLHPTAERMLVDFLKKDEQLRFVISTHSSVIMNSVEPGRITYLSPPGVPFGPRKKLEPLRILSELGYRFSDFLAYDRMIFVEGESDMAVLPVLLQRSGQMDPRELDKTGFAPMGGAGRIYARKMQDSILYYEKLLDALGRERLPRLCLFDGDHGTDDRNILAGTSSVGEEDRIKAVFLPRCEMENYLLVPEAIISAMQEEATLLSQKVKLTFEDVRIRLKALLDSDDKALYPSGKGKEPGKDVKGSAVLEKLYDGFALRYKKRESGLLIAQHITSKNQPALVEIVGLIAPLFK